MVDGDLQRQQDEAEGNYSSEHDEQQDQQQEVVDDLTRDLDASSYQDGSQKLRPDKGKTTPNSGDKKVAASSGGSSGGTNSVTPRSDADVQKDADAASGIVKPEKVVETLEGTKDVVATAEAIQASLKKRHPGYGTTFNGYGSGSDKYVCTTFVQTVLEQSGYKMDKKTKGLVNITGVGADELEDAVANGDDETKGVVTALVNSEQGLEVPIDAAKPTALLEPGDFVQYWYHYTSKGQQKLAGHVIIVHAVTDDKHVTALGSHHSKKGVADLKGLNLSTKLKVYAVRGAGHAKFPDLVRYRAAHGLPTGKFLVDANPASTGSNTTAGNTTPNNTSAKNATDNANTSAGNTSAGNTTDNANTSAGNTEGTANTRGQEVVYGAGADLRDMRDIYSDPSVQFVTDGRSESLYEKVNGTFVKSGVVAGGHTPYRMLGKDGDYQKVELIFAAGRFNAGDVLYADAKTTFGTSQEAAKWFVGDASEEIDFMEEHGGVATQLWSQLREGGESEAGQKRQYANTDHKTYCNFMVQDLFAALAKGSGIPIASANDMYDKMPSAPNFREVSLPQSKPFDLYDAVWAQHANKGEAVFFIAQAGDHGHIALAVPTSRKGGGGDLTYGNVMQGGGNVGFMKLTWAWASDDIKTGVGNGTFKAYVYTGTLAAPRVGSSTITPGPDPAEVAANNEAAIDVEAGVSDEKKKQDADVKSYRALMKDPDKVAEQRNAPVTAAATEAADAQAKKKQSDEDAVRDEELSKYDGGGKFKQWRRDKKEAELKQLGLITDEPARTGPDALLKAADQQITEGAPGDRDLILQRVKSLVNKLYFQQDQDLEADQVALIAADLTKRVTAGRVAQQYLADVEAFWSHFTVQRASRDERKAMKGNEGRKSEEFQEYKQDRKHTRRLNLKHSKVGVVTHKVTHGGEPPTGATPEDARALVGTARASNSGLDPFILNQPAKAPDELGTTPANALEIAARVDKLDGVDALGAALVNQFAALVGIDGLPAVRDGASAPVGDDKTTEPKLEPGPGEELDPEALEAAPEADPEVKPTRWLTVAFKTLVELALGIHAETSHTSKRLKTVLKGDRVPATDVVKPGDNKHDWAQALVDGPKGKPRLGWIDTKFTNLEGDDQADQAQGDGQDPTKGDAAKSLVGDVPKGLTVISYLRPLKPTDAVPLYADVYSLKGGKPVETVKPTDGAADLLRVWGQTADNDADLYEVLAGGRPLYAPRGLFRVADPEERLIQCEQLTVEEIHRVRAYANTKVQDPAVKAAFFELLQQKPLYQAATASAVVDDAHRVVLSGLAMGLELLGVPNPYSKATSYADALEMVRLEQGIEDVSPATLSVLASKFGVATTATTLDAALDDMKGGASVLGVSADGAAVRLRGKGKADGTWSVDDPKAGEAVDRPVADLQDLTWLKLSWASDTGEAYDRDTEGDVKLDSPAIDDAATAVSAYETKVYGSTSQKEDDWYLSQSSGVHGLDATRKMRSFLPSGKEAAAMAPAAQQKAYEDWLRKKGSATVELLAEIQTQFVAPLIAAGGHGQSMEADISSRAKTIISNLLANDRSQPHYDAALSSISAAEKAGLITKTVATTYREQAKQNLMPAPPGPTDADFAALSQDDKGVPVPGFEGAEEVVYTPSPPTYVIDKQRVSVKIGGRTIVFRYTWMANTSSRYKSNSFMGGWVTEKVLIGDKKVGTTGANGERVGHLSEKDLEKLGLSKTEQQMLFGEANRESGSIGYAAINAYDRAFVSAGNYQLIGMQENERYDHNNLANAVGPLSKYKENEDIFQFLRSAGIELIQAKGYGADKGWGFKVKSQPTGKVYKTGENIDAKEVLSIYASHNVDPQAEVKTCEAKVKSYAGKTDKESKKLKAEWEKRLGLAKTNITKLLTKTSLHNAAALVMRLEPLKLAAISAAFTDPRVQAATVLVKKKSFFGAAAKATFTKPPKKKVYDYVWSEAGRGLFAYAINGQGATGARDLAQATVAELDKGSAKDLWAPANWTADTEAKFREGFARKTKLTKYLSGPGKDLDKTRPSSAPSGSNINGKTVGYADIGKLFKGQALPERADDRGTNDKQVAKDKGGAKPNPPSLEKYQRLAQDPRRLETIEAVYQSEAGKRNLDGHTAPTVATIKLARPVQTSVVAAAETWLERMVGYAQVATTAVLLEEAMTLAKAIDVAVDVAAKYPTLASASPRANGQDHKGHSQTSGNGPLPPYALTSTDDNEALDNPFDWRKRWSVPSGDDGSTSKRQAAGNDNQVLEQSAAPYAQDIMRVTDPNALYRDPKTLNAPKGGKKIPKGTKLKIIAAKGKPLPNSKVQEIVQVVSAEGNSIKAADDVWTALSNMVVDKLGDTSGRDKIISGVSDKIAGVKKKFKNRPKASPSFGPHYAQVADGKQVSGALLANVKKLIDWANANELLDSVSYTNGMRSPKLAHRWSVAYEIHHAKPKNVRKKDNRDKSEDEFQSRSNVTMAALKALPGGKDLDGNLWYEEGWDWEDVAKNASKWRKEDESMAAEGYAFGDNHRLPNNLNGGLSVTRHATGLAVDVKLTWRLPNGGIAQDTNEWDAVFAAFNIKRPLKDKSGTKREPWHYVLA